MIIYHKSGIKTFVKKSGRKLPKPVLDMIQTKNLYAKALNSARLSASQGQIKSMEQHLTDLKQEVKNAISDYNLTRRHKLRNRYCLP